jgi:hypothetical protein
MLENRFYIYRHIRPDTNEVFYIGKGNNVNPKKGLYERMNISKKRNKIWQSIVLKNNGIFKAEILFECETEEECNAKEIEFIALYGRKDLNNGTLANLTSGGDGSLGIITNQETRNKLSLKFKGEAHPNFGKKHSEETCKKKSESMKKSDKNLKGKKLPDWWKDKIRQTKFGKNNPMFGQKSHLAKAVVDIETGIEYHSIMEAAKSTQYQFQYVSAMLNGSKPNKTNLRYKDGL